MWSIDPEQSERTRLSNQVSPLTDQVVEAPKRRFRRDLLTVFFAGGHREQFRHGQGCPLLDAIRPAFLLRGTLRSDFGKALMTRDMPEACEFPFLAGCLKGFLWVHKELKLATYPLVGIWAPSRRRGKLPSGIWSRKPGSFSRSH